MHNAREIRSVLIPLHENMLLLPNACVAEVIAYSQPVVGVDVGVDWYKGMISWRNHNVPVLSVDALLDTELPPDDILPLRSRIIICNLPGGDENFPYVGIIAASIPRLARVSVETVAAEENEGGLDDLPLVSAVVGINGTEAIIPDLTYLESQLKVM